MGTIILASGSPRRKKLLQKVQLPFKVVVSASDESYDPNLSPENIVKELALRKAREVAAGFTEALVIGADTIVVFQGRILQKPVDTKEARHMLHQLSGRTHEVLTGVALYKIKKSDNIDESFTFYEKTEVTFGVLNPDDIQAYVAGGSPMDKAGGYGIQDDLGALFVEKIKGDYNNVVGFPLHAFYTKLRSFAPEYLSKFEHKRCPE